MQDFSHYELAEIHQLIKIPSFNCFIVEIRLRGDNSASPDGTLRNDSGQAHFTVKMPVRKEGGRSARLLILYSVPVVNI
jgi:hypothetical protein